MEKINITANTTLGETIAILDLKPGQKKKGKTPTRLKLTTSEEPLVQIHGSKLCTVVSKDAKGDKQCCTK